MSVNFYKHRDEIVEAYNDVMSSKTKTDWVMFGYEKQTNDLMVLDRGAGGLEQLADEFDSSKIQYAFCRVVDPNNDIAKYVLINWQGEGAPINRKSACINHFRDVADYFKGAHLTINARNEDEVEPAAILAKVTRVSARVNVKERIETTDNVGPVGTNYKRVQPQREISQTDRQKFWSKTQEDEEKRVEDDKKRVAENRSKIEKERCEREREETRRREEAIRERENLVSKMREAQKNAENATRNEAAKAMSGGGGEPDEDERRKRSESLRRERNEEAKSVISHGSIRNARAVFEQNSSVGQMNSFRTSDPPNRQPNTGSTAALPKITVPTTVIPQVIGVKRNEASGEKLAQEERKVVETETVIKEVKPVASATPANSDDVCQTTIEKEKQAPTQQAPAPVVVAPVAVAVAESPAELEVASFPVNVVQSFIESEPLEDIVEEEQNWEEPGTVANGKASDTGEPVELKTARALYDYQAADDTEISFDPDDLITHIEMIDEGWWQGMAPDGTYGLFPANYVELID